MSNLDVLIVGAGPTGMAFAIDLYRRGNHNIRIVDKKECASQHSKALGIHAKTLEVLNMMGILDQFLQEGVKTKGVILHHGKKEHCLNLLTIDSPTPYLLTIPQNVSEKILEKNLPIDIEWNTEVISCTEGEYTLSKNGQTEKVCPQWVVGCDGANSYIRQSNNLPFSGSKFDHTVHLIDAVGESGFDEKYYHAILNTKKPAVLIFPMSVERSRVISLKGVSLNAFFKIKKNLWESDFVINSRHVPTVHFKNIFLCGDAAHIHSPIGGQGMNTSIQDGFNLSWKLDLVLKGAAPHSLLDSYEKERLPVIKSLVRLTRIATYNFFFSPRLLKAIAYRLVGLLFKSPMINHTLASFVAQLKINYKKSPIVQEASPKMRGIKAGDRLPDAMLHDGSYVHQLLRNTTKHTLLLMEENHELISYVRSHYGEWIDVKVIHGDFMKAKYHAGPKSIYLIRPDGYVGFRAYQGCHETFKSYLKELFLTT